MKTIPFLILTSFFIHVQSDHEVFSIAGKSQVWTLCVSCFYYTAEEKLVKHVVNIVVLHLIVSIDANFNVQSANPHFMDENCK